ncbi:MAG: type I pullulanase [Clostridia bacterium]|nr:type I pullulanase [Clostridia bacterium]
MIYPGALYDTEEFISKYTCPDGQFGVNVTDKYTEFRLWAPTASRVELVIYPSGNDSQAEKRIDLNPVDQGAWYLRVDENLSGKYYNYAITNLAGTKEAVDPYAVTTGVNGRRGMIINLKETDPKGWDKDGYIQNIDTYCDSVIWEVHVADFSAGIASSKYQGKFLAFTEKGLKNSSGKTVGLDYLKNLGVTHVHFQPLADYGSVDESSNRPQYNWGYDPTNYNVPEGSYSTDPFHGEVRVRELKEMVMALHEAGIGVVMDVVYNHTYSKDSSLNRVVPGYYYRSTQAGAFSDGSGCGNETASDRIMFRKYMIDSILYWQKEYHIDGFRFDLMALHDLETIHQIEKAVHKVNPKALLYGEGWTGGHSMLAEDERASRENIVKIEGTKGAAGSVAIFNDIIRDSIKGNNFCLCEGGFVNGKPWDHACGVVFGMMGATDSMDQFEFNTNSALQSINYMSCHDNMTLRDKLACVTPKATDTQLKAMSRIGAVALFTGLGIPFMLGGEEMLRSKGGNFNSYNAPIETNMINWEVLKPNSSCQKLSDFYKGLIALRKRFEIFRQDADQVEITYDFIDGCVVVFKMVHKGITSITILNPLDRSLEYKLPEGIFAQYVSKEKAQATPLEENLHGVITIRPMAGQVYISQQNEQK